MQRISVSIPLVDRDVLVIVELGRWQERLLPSLQLILRCCLGRRSALSSANVLNLDTFVMLLTGRSSVSFSGSSGQSTSK